jgi:hypothetical protein
MTVTAYTTKDSGKRQQYANGMKRDTNEGKPRFNLMVPKEVPYNEQILTRVAELLARGAVKYGDRNWESGWDPEALERAYDSAMRHLMQWMCGETDEDHAAAVVFNIMQVEYLEYMRPKPSRWEQVVAAPTRKDREHWVEATEIPADGQSRKDRIEALKKKRAERQAKAKDEPKEPVANTAELKPPPERVPTLSYAELMKLRCGSIVESTETGRRFIKEEGTMVWLGLEGLGRFSNAGLIAMFGSKLKEL